MKRLFSRAHQQNNETLSAASFAPMVDLFTILVIAILRASSPETSFQMPEKNFLLPISKLERSPQPATIIDIGQDGIYVNGQRNTSTTYWLKNDEVLITDLYEVLQGLSAKKAHIRAHAKVPWTIVDKTLLTAQQAGCGDIELIALSNLSL